ncbi:MAG: glutaredoxin [Anaerocolumna sp.]|jgi:thiol-disulfide isomerase/thioredoxin|nr:glutaredoxin [Anaerocolumna sp.]
MKNIIMFETSWCPHCHRAHGFLEELLKDNPAYKDVQIQYIDEELHPDIAKQYDYYYVPTFYVDSVKIHEGAVTKDSVDTVLVEALS